jgi:hypothetical protein
LQVARGNSNDCNARRALMDEGANFEVDMKERKLTFQVPFFKLISIANNFEVPTSLNNSLYVRLNIWKICF